MTGEIRKIRPFAKTTSYYAVVVLALGALPLVVRNPYYAHIFIMFFFYAFLAMAWNIIGGYGGQLSLGHAVFYGLGAYTSTLLFVHFNLTPWIGMLIGGLVAALVSMVIGFPCFRLHGPFFAMSTLAVLEVFRILTVYFSDLTQGSIGITIPIKFGPANMIFEDKMTYLYVIMGFFSLSVIVTKLIERSKFGYELIALREDEEAAESAGVHVTWTKLKAMVISAFLTALAGTFHAQYVLYIDPSGEFGLSISVLMAIMAILGGVGTVLGPILGAALLVPLQEFLRGWLGGQLHGLHLFIYGLLLIIVVIFLPHGMFEWLKGWLSPWINRSQSLLPEMATAKRPGGGDLPAWASGTKGMRREHDVILSTRNLWKRFGGLVAIRDLDIDIRQGEIIGLIGPNGAGKTTFFNLISGFFKPDSGLVEYNGSNITGVVPAHKLSHKGIGRTFQIVKPFGNITVLKNVMVGAFCRVASESEAKERALEILDFVGLYHRKEDLAKGLTIEDRKRLELGRALATGPSLLLLDEIMAGLNPREIAEAIELIRKIRGRGTTVILIEHVMQAVMNLSDRVIILHHGEKIAEGPPRDVASDETVIKAYLGEEYAIA